MKREGYDVNNKHLDNQFMALGGDNDSEERSLRNFERLDHRSPSGIEDVGIPGGQATKTASSRADGDASEGNVDA